MGSCQVPTLWEGFSNILNHKPLSNHSSEEGLLLAGNALRAVEEAVDSGASESSDEAGTDASHDRGSSAVLGSGLLSEHGSLVVDAVSLRLDGAGGGVNDVCELLANFLDDWIGGSPECLLVFLGEFLIDRLDILKLGLDDLSGGLDIVSDELVDLLGRGAVVGDPDVSGHILLLHGLHHGLTGLAEEDLSVLQQFTDGSAVDGEGFPEVLEELVVSSNPSGLASLEIFCPLSTERVTDRGKGFNGLLTETLGLFVELLNRRTDGFERGKVEAGLVLGEGLVGGLLVDALAHVEHSLLESVRHVKSIAWLAVSAVAALLHGAFVL